MASFLVKFIIKGKDMLKIKKWFRFTILFIFVTSVNALNVGDTVYVVLGNKSSAYVKKAHITKVGSKNSKVDWINCSDCYRWVDNKRFYYTYNSAQKIVDKMDSEHISFGEVAGTVAIIGFIGALIHAASKK